jgi:Carbohydrate esterase, sialic acid-specific acetylesterase
MRQPIKHTAISPILMIASPVDYQVFQRKTLANGTIVLDISTADDDVKGIEFRLVGTSRVGSLDLAWQTIRMVGPGHYHCEPAEPAGGWYRLDLRVLREDQITIAPSIEHVGIGEVFVVGGQSNSTCWGEKRQQTATRLVSNFDGKTWTLAKDPLPGVDGKGGSPWPIFGDAMVAKYAVPIGIVPVGAGATSVRQWLPKGQRVQIQASTTRALKKVGENEWECDGKLFDRMVTRMWQLGPNGFRAMLWHQGESDAHQANGRTLPPEKYQQYMEMIIRTSRTSAGWDVPWFVAQATYHNPADPGSTEIRDAQKALWDEKLAMQGPDTDTLTGDNRQNNGKGVHMSDKGLHAHAALWVQRIEDYLNGKLNSLR